MTHFRPSAGQARPPSDARTPSRAPVGETGLKAYSGRPGETGQIETRVPPHKFASLIGAEGFGVFVDGEGLAAVNLHDGDLVWIRDPKVPLEYGDGDVVIASPCEWDGDSPLRPSYLLCVRRGASGLELWRNRCDGTEFLATSDEGWAVRARIICVEPRARLEWNPENAPVSYVCRELQNVVPVEPGIDESAR
jgi:hypothetical protein